MLAGATLVVAVVTLVVAQANLKSVLLREIREVAQDSGRTDLESAVDKALEVGIGFWLVVAALVVVLLLNAGTAVLSRRAREPSPTLET